MKSTSRQRVSALVFASLGLLVIACSARAQAQFSSAEILSAHNTARAAVGVPPLSLSDTLSASAQAWANHLKDTRNCGMQHSSSGLGENLLWASARSNGTAQQIAPQKVVESWVKEQSDYDYSSNSCAPGKVCGHYTQVVWKDSLQVGCAMAICESPKSQVWVCQYSPAGNYIGQKPY